MTDTTNMDPRGPSRGWQAFWPVRLIRVLAGALWRFILYPIYLVFREIARYVVTTLAFALARTAAFAATSWRWLRYGFEPSNDLLGRLIDRWVGGYMRDPWIRIPFTSASLVIGSPLMFLMVLVIGFGLPVVALTYADQKLYQQHTLPAQFQIAPGEAPLDLTRAEKAVLVTDALVYQLEYELDSAAEMTWEDWKTLNFNGFLGWTPNDVAGYGPLAWLDNRVNRQLGVIYATRIMTDTWAVETSKLGSADLESVDLVQARTSGFSFDSRKWFLPATEGYYRDGIERVRTYQRKLLSGASDAQTNVTTKDMVDVFAGLKRMLDQPYGRLTDRNSAVSYSELDDVVFYAQGAAIVARDMLAAISIAYPEEFERGQLDVQIAQAIDSLNAISQFHPWVITRGAEDSIVADHRSKVARYYSEAFRRIEDVMKALQS